MATILILGFSSGLPLMLTAGGSTIQAWMKDGNVDLPTIGRFALIGLPYALKFLWAPLLDSYAPPLFKMGRRRGWALIMQLGVALSIAFLAFCDPSSDITTFAIAAVLVAFFSASQDIVLDALRTESLSKEELGPGGSLYLTGYRLAMLVSGALALALSATLPWKTVYLGMSALMAVGMLAILKMPEPAVSAPKYGTFKERVLIPFVDFFKRQGAMEILVFVMLYKLPTLMATALTTVFLLDLGFDKIEIAAVSKVAGLIATIVGTLAGGALMVRLGIKAALWIFGAAQALGGGLFIVLAVVGKSHLAMVGVIIADNFLMGMGTAAIVGFMMSICSKQFTGTQYALLSSLTAFTRVILIAPAGTLAQSLGWTNFFVLSIVLAAPGLFLLTRYERWTRLEGKTAERLHPADLFVMITFMTSLVVISTEFVWPKLGLPDVGLYVGGGGLLLALGAWILKAYSKSSPGSIGTS
jgi:MFS transporter, PAT family, beta-lactamase induction signal transducer AmpG